MRLMRERPPAEFRSAPGAPMEICHQTIMLGFAFDRIYGPEAEQDIFDPARLALEQEGNVFGTTRLLPRFIDTMRARLQLPPLGAAPGSRNACDITAQARDIEEFEASLPQIRTMITMERALYDIVAGREIP